MPVLLFLLWVISGSSIVAQVDDAQGWLSRARAYAKDQKRSEAIEAARKAEDLGGADPKILQGLADFYAIVLPDPPKAADLGQRYAER